MGSIKALIIENDIKDISSIRSQLEEQKDIEFTFEYASRLAEGLEKVANDRYDIVLLNPNLPDGNGMDAVRRFLSKASHVPVIILTGIGNEAEGLGALQVGAQDYLVMGKTDSELFVRSIRCAIHRKKAQDELRRSEEKYRHLVETAYEGIWLLDQNYRTVFVNRKMSELLGYSRKEMEGKAMNSFTDMEWARHIRDLDDNLKLDPALVNDFKFMRKDGTSIWAVVSCRWILDNNNKHIGTLAVVTDISDRKRMEEQLRMAKEELERRLNDARYSGRNRTDGNEASR